MEHTYIATCTHCSTQVEFSREEAKEESHGIQSFVYVDCPICKKQISKKTLDSVQNAAKRYGSQQWDR